MAITFIKNLEKFINEIKDSAIIAKTNEGYVCFEYEKEYEIWKKIEKNE